RARTASLKKSLLEKLIEKFDVSNSQEPVRHYIQFLSNQELPLIQMLISFGDFHPTEQSLQAALTLPLESVRSALQTLMELDLIQKISSEKFKEPYWVSKNKPFKIPGEISDPAVQLFHEQALNEAQEKVRVVSGY